MLSLKDKDNALQCVDGESYFARSALELSDTIYQKHQLRCDHSVTISQRSCLHLSCDVFANDTFWHKIIRIKLDHLYRFATYVSFISITAKTT